MKIHDFGFQLYLNGKVLESVVTECVKIHNFLNKKSFLGDTDVSIQFYEVLNFS